VQPDDVPVFFTHQADADAAETAAVASRNRADHEAHWAKILADPEVTIRAVVEATPGGEVVTGNVLTFVRDGRREVGYWLGREFWGRGIATAALRLFVAEYPGRPLAACVSSANGPSATVLLRNGFRELSTTVTDDGVRLRNFVLD
jgi:RimJ/RimL family protein N-acetyltransferase